MTQDGLDAEGYIEIRCSVEKISPDLRPIVEASIALLTLRLGARLHGIYLYGSVATGEAKPGQSDIDLIVMFGNRLSDEEATEIEVLAESLSTSYQAFVREVAIGAVSVQEALAEESLPGLGCFIKHLCVCVAGEDIRTLLPKFRPSMEVARGFNGDYATVVRAMLGELAEADELAATQSVMRRICRKTVRTSFGLVMPRLGCWTTELKSSCAYFCRFYPEQCTGMFTVLRWIEQPPEEKAEFLRTIMPLVEWLSREFDRVIGS